MNSLDSISPGGISSSIQPGGVGVQSTYPGGMRPTGVRHAEEWILDDRTLALAAPERAFWRPDGAPVAIGRSDIVPVPALLAVSGTSRFGSKNVRITPVVDPIDALISASLGGPALRVDSEGAFDQPHSVVKIEAGNERTFTRFWERLGVSLGLPKGATAEEIGLTTISGMEFKVVRSALTNIKAREERRNLKPYKRMLSS